MRTLLPKSDPWHQYYATPKWIARLIKNKALGQKTRRGIYEKTKNGITVLDLKSGKYRLSDQTADKSITTILKEPNVSKRFKKLRKTDHPQAQFLWAVFRDIWHYSAITAKDIAENVRDIDRAMRLGFGWSEGPFETWQKVGWQQVTDWLNQDIKAGRSLAKKALPKWATEIKGPYQTNKALCLQTGKFTKCKDLPVYKRQLWPPQLLREIRDKGITLFENEGARLWTHGDGITILSFKTKMCTINDSVLEAIQTSLKITAADHGAMVIYQPESDNFSAGADLMGFAEKFMLGGSAALKPSLILFQQTMLNVRYAPIPVIAATRGYVFGGACELQMHCDHTVAALESYVGLVELGVGLIPGAGGTKEMTLRASHMQDPEKALQKHFKQIAMADVAKSALQAKEMNYLRPTDTVIFNSNELLYVAKLQARTVAESGYRPPLKPHITLQGIPTKATIQWLVVNLREGGFATEFDYEIAMKLANIMSGGGVDQGAIVDESWLLRLEREAFLSLVDDDRTHARIEHMLTTGKPLRN